MTDATYKGECRLKRWADSPQGMTVTVQLDDGPDGCKVNPFKDLQLGQRLAVMFVPINDDETLSGQPNSDAGLPTADDVKGILREDANRAQDGKHMPSPPTTATAAASLGKAAASKPKRKWHELPPSQQAAIACQSVVFQEWCGVGDADKAAAFIRKSCFVTSRRQLDDNIGALNRWQELWDRYEDDTGRRAEDRS